MESGFCLLSSAESIIPDLPDGIAVDAVFAGYHIPVLVLFVTPAWTILSFIILASIAWVWRVTVVRYGGLVMPVFTHAVADASIMWAVWVIIANETR